VSTSAFIPHSPGRRCALTGPRFAFWAFTDIFTSNADASLHFDTSSPPTPPLIDFSISAISPRPIVTIDHDKKIRYTNISTRTLARAIDSVHTSTMKYFQQTVEFDYSWEEVSTSNWQKYGPWNEKTPHVIAVDTLSRTVDPVTGIVSLDIFFTFTCPTRRHALTTHQLRSERLITCRQNTPKWVNTILGIGNNDNSMVYETSYVDPVAQKLTLCSMNVTWADLLNVRETCVYQPAPTSTQSTPTTTFTQRAEITALCGGWQKIKNSIEQFTVERFQQNAAKGKEGFEMVLEKAREVFQEQREMVRLQQNSQILREAKM